MISLKQLSAALLGAALIGVGSSASAVVIRNTDNPVAGFPFGGFDWAQNGSAVTTGFTGAPGGSLTTVYWANAISITDPNGAPLNTPNLFPPTTGPNAYEYTVLAQINETVLSCNTPGCTSANFGTTGGTFTIWYDTTPDSNLITGTGITDGIPIISGTINPGFAGTFTASGTGGVGVFQFTGNVTSTNTAFVDPALVSSNAVATLQFGSSTTNWVPPTGTPVGGIPAGALVFQADGNQAFTAAVIPEPGTLALGGLSLLLVGLLRRRA
jgi:hypothetical protein